MVMPLSLLEKSMNKKVSLLLKDSRMLEGTLTGFDDYLNMVLEDTEETNGDQVKRLGVVILRGNNVVSISPQ
ncbi:MAG: LSM domain-containing protein [Thermoplasmata archaeon]|jgi:small nuclear ribonucleoprotein|nr:RNA-binding protein [Candidatus Thermoplasmatota archaeon]MCJ7489379.1 LSM domain-containing protein [Thermoplasmata archaeon]